MSVCWKAEVLTNVKTRGHAKSDCRNEQSLGGTSVGLRGLDVIPCLEEGPLNKGQPELHWKPCRGLKEAT